MARDLPPNREQVAFKKQAHRPWKPTLLEGPLRETQPLSQSTRFDQNDLTQKQLETTLELKTQEKDDLNYKLSLLDQNRIMLGGFLQPKHLLAYADNDALNHSSTLMQELREKEQEILEITYNLKITQALEKAEHAESAQKASDEARVASEEKAMNALKQAKMAAEQARYAEERAYLAEKQNHKAEETVRALQEKLKVTEHELSLASNILQQEESVRLAADAELTQKLMHAQENLAQFEQELTQERAHSCAQENEIMSLHDKLSSLRKDKEHLEALLVKTMDRMDKMGQALGLERNLRTLFEDKTREARNHALTLSAKQKAEEYSRKAIKKKLQDLTQ